MNKRIKKLEKGITLIALVITIIVLLILAGVTIASLTGENGLLNKAVTAKEATERAELIEQMQLEILGEQADSNGDISETELKAILEKYGTVNYEEDGITINSITTDKGGYKILISDILGEITVSEREEETPSTPEEPTAPTLTGLEASDITVEKGETATIILIKTPSDVTEELSYVSSDENIAIVDESGVVTGVGVGTATITITGKTTTSVTTTCTVTVITPEPVADGSWSDEEGVNTPLLVSGLTAVTFNSDGSVTEVESSNYANWYNYSNGEWANAVTKDSSGNITGYWVWIPRYEYKINSDTQTTTVKFIPTTQTTVDNGYEHVHPAFCNGSSTNYTNGEWDKEISGFWVAKFPAGWQQNTITDNSGRLSTTISNRDKTLVSSSSNYTYTSEYSTVPVGSISTSTKMSLPVFLPLTYAYNCISIGDIYTLAQQVSRSSNSSSFYGLNLSNSDSHMLKNSEWGAIAYLTQSQYGRNGAEPNINNYYTSTSKPYRVALTGIYASGTTTSSTTTLGNAWYTSTGQLGSSTGNLTGVYDLNGCVYERFAGYITNGNANLGTCGSSFVATTTANADGYKTLSTKYATVYPYNSSSDSAANNWTVYNGLKTSIYGYGDAILETSTAGSGSVSWYSDYSGFAFGSTPFFGRGGGYNTGSSAGAFAFNVANSSQGHNIGFRVVLVCE